MKKDKIIFLICLIILSIFALNCFVQIAQNAVDVLFWDEWDMLPLGRVDKKLNCDWVFAFHNEHKIVWTKLLTWVQYNIDGWNIKNQIIFNFFIYLGMIYMLFKVIPSKNPYLPLFFIPLFSNIHNYNFLTAFQSQFYLMLLFSFLAVIWGFNKESCTKNALIFSLFTGCAMFSMTFTVGPSLLFVYILKERNKKCLLIAAGIVLFLTYLFFAGGTSYPELQMKLTSPFEPLFWTYFSELICRSVFNLRLWYIYIPHFLILVFGFLGLVYYKSFRNKELFGYAALITLSFGFALAITCARGVDGSISGRHFIVISYLIPVIAGFLSDLKIKSWVAALGLFILWGYFPAFDNGVYPLWKNLREEAKTELLNASGNEIYINALLDKNLAPYIKRAKELDISCFRLGDK